MENEEKNIGGLSQKEFHAKVEDMQHNLMHGLVDEKTAEGIVLYHMGVEVSDYP